MSAKWRKLIHSVLLCLLVASCRPCGLSNWKDGMEPIPGFRYLQQSTGEASESQLFEELIAPRLESNEIPRLSAVNLPADTVEYRSWSIGAFAVSGVILQANSSTVRMGELSFPLGDMKHCPGSAVWTEEPVPRSADFDRLLAIAGTMPDSPGPVKMRLDDLLLVVEMRDKRGYRYQEYFGFDPIESPATMVPYDLHKALVDRAERFTLYRGLPLCQGRCRLR